MKVFSLALLRLIVMMTLAPAVVTVGFVRNSSGVVPPCPVATDATIDQMARQWATSFKTPYCDYLNERRNILLKHKLVAGVLRQASVMSKVLRVSEKPTGPDVAKRIEKAARRVNLKNVGAKDAASAKLRLVRTGIALTVYSAGAKAFTTASRLEKTLENLAPTIFDVSSRQQAQKDTAKLAHLRGLIQAQELRLLSLLKMMDATEGAGRP